MNKFTYISLFIVSNFFLSAQTSYSEYITISTTTVSKKTDLSTFELGHQTNSESSTDNEETIAFEKGIVTKSRSKIYSNCQYSYLKIILEEINIPFVPVGKESEVTLLADKTNKVVYDLKKLSYFVYKDPDTLTIKPKHEKDSVFTQNVISRNKKDTAIITFKKTLPKCLTSSVILSNIPCGIQKIQTKKQNTTLTLLKEKSYFNFSKELEHAKKVCLKQGVAINLLFPK